MSNSRKPSISDNTMKRERSRDKLQEEGETTAASSALSPTNKTAAAAASPTSSRRPSISHSPRRPAPSSTSSSSSSSSSKHNRSQRDLHADVGGSNGDGHGLAPPNFDGSNDHTTPAKGKGRKKSNAGVISPTSPAANNDTQSPSSLSTTLSPPSGANASSTPLTPNTSGSSLNPMLNLSASKLALLKRPVGSYTPLTPGQSSQASSIPQLDPSKWIFIDTAPALPPFDSTLPSTILWIVTYPRKKHQVKLNCHCTVRQLYALVKYLSGVSEAFDLLYSYPPRVLTVPDATLSDLNLDHCSLLQRLFSDIPPPSTIAIRHIEQQHREQEKEASAAAMANLLQSHSSMHNRQESSKLAINMPISPLLASVSAGNANAAH